MSKLDQNEITLLHLAQDFVPEAFGDESATAASTPCAIQHVYFCSIKVSDERIAPSEAAVSMVVGGRVTDDEDGPQLRIDRRLFVVVLTRGLGATKGRRKDQQRDNCRGPFADHKCSCAQ